MRLFILSGISGAGNSTALNAFEDLGYFCVDNLPAPLVANFVDFVEAKASASAIESSPLSIASTQPVKPARLRTHFALLVDIRDEESAFAVSEAVSRLRSSQLVEVTHLFVDCDDDVIIRRYQETRRPHPLLARGVLMGTVREALTKEREVLSQIRSAADRIIDTTSLTPHDLRRFIENCVRDQVGAKKSSIEVTLQSFGFKYGAPRDADIVIDVRFLPNPHFVPELREFNGKDKRVADYVFSNGDANEFLRHYGELLKFLLPRYEREGKRYVTVAIGCTGGHHRSVSIGERLAEYLLNLGFVVNIRHRDISRNV